MRAPSLSEKLKENSFMFILFIKTIGVPTTGWLVGWLVDDILSE